MRYCIECGHDFFWAKVEGAWYPYEYITAAGTYRTTDLVNGEPIVTYRYPVQLHQCRREWVREFHRRLATPCSKCGAEAGNYCIAMSGSYPRPTLRTLMHESRGIN